MNFLKRAALSYLAKTVEKSLPHLTDEELHLQLKRAQLNVLDATDPEAEAMHIGILNSLGEEVEKRDSMKLSDEPLPPPPEGTTTPSLILLIDGLWKARFWLVVAAIVGLVKTFG